MATKKMSAKVVKAKVVEEYKRPKLWALLEISDMELPFFLDDATYESLSEAKSMQQGYEIIIEIPGEK